MIVGLGCDICNIERIKKAYKRFGKMFIQRCFGSIEQQEMENFQADEERIIPSLAKKFAAKEAFVKALGTGFSDGIAWDEIQVIHDNKGKPIIQISGRAEEILKQKVDSYHIWVSLSDDTPWAQAVVIIESDYV